MKNFDYILTCSDVKNAGLWDGCCGSCCDDFDYGYSGVGPYVYTKHGSYDCDLCCKCAQFEKLGLTERQFVARLVRARRNYLKKKEIK